MRSVKVVSLTADREHANANWQVAFGQFTTAATGTYNEGLCHRISLLYPIAPASFVLPSADQRYRLHFFGALDPLSAYEAVPRHRLSGCSLASIGAASLVVWSEDSESTDLGMLTAEVQEHLVFYEVWLIGASGELLNVLHPYENNATSVDVPDAYDVPVALRSHRSHSIAREASYHLNILRQSSARLAPDIASELTLLARSVADAASAITSVLQIRSQLQTSSTLDNGALSDYSAQLLLRMRIDDHLAHLTQLSSAFSYACSQLTAGQPPILENPGLIYPHTLLGATSAWRAINHAYRGVFSAFRSVNQHETLRKKLTGEEHTLAPGETNVPPRVVHFSGRQGYSETEASITFPTYTLSQCITPGWTLSTLTHEALHSQVKLLLAAALMVRGPDGQTLPAQTCFVEFARRYIEATQGKTGAPALAELELLPNGQDKLCLRLIWHALAFAAMHSKANSRKARAHGEKPEQIPVVLPKDPPRLLARINDSLRFFDELFVHTLDVEYFFAGNGVHFARTLWSSWSMIPTVTANYEMYVLRTLATIGGLKHGDVWARLAAAKDDLERALADLDAMGQSNPLINIVRALLRQTNGPEKTWLDRMFPEALRFVQVVRADFLSDELRARFARDFIVKDSTISVGEFTDPIRTTPLGLLCAQRDMEFEAGGVKRDFEGVLRDSAWLLLATTSVGFSEWKSTSKDEPSR